MAASLEIPQTESMTPVTVPSQQVRPKSNQSFLMDRAGAVLCCHMGSAARPGAAAAAARTNLTQQQQQHGAHPVLNVDP